MKYYSESTRLLYDTEKEALEAEKALTEKREAEEKAKAQKKAERATRAKEVNEALKAADEANVKARNLLNAFLKDYGSYHTTIHEETTPEGLFKRHSIFSDELNDLFTNAFKGFFGE